MCCYKLESSKLVLSENHLQSTLCVIHVFPTPKSNLHLNLVIFLKISGSKAIWTLNCKNMRLNNLYTCTCIYAEISNRLVLSLFQAKGLLKFVEAISEKTLRSTVAMTAARGRGKSAALGLAMATAVGFG